MRRREIGLWQLTVMRSGSGRAHRPGFKLHAPIDSKGSAIDGPPLTLAFCCHLERLHNISAHPHQHEGFYKRGSEPVRPLQSNRCREHITRALTLGNEFVHESRVIMSLELDKVDSRC